MGIRYDETVRDAKTNAAVDQIDVGTGTAKLQLRSGPRPTNITDPPSGTLLAEFDLPNPCFGDSVAGTATANVITPVVGLAAGDVGHARVLNRDGDRCWDQDSVGTSGEVAILLNRTDVAVGADVEVLSWTYTTPEQ